MSVPQGYSGAAAVQRARDLSDEGTYPSTATVLGFLNESLEEVCRRIGGPRLFKGYPTVNNQTTIDLDDDVLDIVSANFSSGAASANNTGSSSPFVQGALVYPMTQLDQQTFMDSAAGFPAVGFGPPQAYFIYRDEGRAPTNALDPPPAAQLAVIDGTSLGTEVEVVLTYVNANGETTASDVADVTPDTDETAQVATPPGLFNASGYNTYAGAVGGPYYLQNSSPTALGFAYNLPYPLVTSGTTPPGSNTAIGAGTGGSLSLQLYPAAMIGQVNVYYRARPQLWADSTTASWTNLDTSAQRAVIYMTVAAILYNRSRGDEAKQLWEPQYEGMIEDLKGTINRRTMPRSGQVRDVTNRSFPSSPFWMN